MIQAVHTRDLVTVLERFLADRDLVLCRAPDTQFALDGGRLSYALRELAAEIEIAMPQAPIVMSGAPTQQITPEMLADLREASDAYQLSILTAEDFDNIPTREIPIEHIRQLREKVSAA